MTRNLDNLPSQQYDTDVVIIGLGPTGLTLAHMLARHDINVVILEKEPEFYGNARAVYTDDECLRIFQDAGITDDLTKDMLQDITFQWVLPNNKILNQFKSTKKPNGWPVSNLFYQPYLETTLTNLLKKYPNVTIKRGREVVDFQQDKDRVIVEHQASDGSSYNKETTLQVVNKQDKATLTAKFAVGCDGGRSAVRTKLDIKMNGKSYPNPWLVVDIKVNEGEDCLRHLPYFNFYCDPNCPTVSCRQPNGHHRFEFMLMPGQTREYMEDPKTIDAYLSKYIDTSKVTILRSLVYTFNALVAEQWRDRRVFLAGDAAHMTPQFIGQGMNAGVRDAYNLGWKIAAVLNGQAQDSLLDSYQTERYPHAKAMIDLSVYMKNFVSLKNPVLASLRNTITRFIKITPFFKSVLDDAEIKPKPTYKANSYFGINRRNSSSLSGSQIPQPTVLNLEGKRFLLDDLLGSSFSLIGYGIDPREGLSPQEIAFYQSLGTHFITLYEHGGRPQNDVQRFTPEGLIEVEDLTGEAIAWFKSAGLCKESVAILRPDKFAFAAVKAGKISQATQILIQELAPSEMAKTPASIKSAA